MGYRVKQTGKGSGDTRNKYLWIDTRHSTRHSPAEGTEATRLVLRAELISTEPTNVSKTSVQLYIFVHFYSYWTGLFQSILLRLISVRFQEGLPCGE